MKTADNSATCTSVQKARKITTYDLSRYEKLAASKKAH
jgi:hypothetical protein